MKQTTNIAIFVSGNGTNCENIIRHFSNSEVARVALVVSNRADAFALERAKRLGVPALTLSKADFANQDSTLKVLDSYGIGFVVLAGFLMMVPGYLLRRYHLRMVNIHPALLPKYGGKGMYGHHVHEAVKANGDTETGITIHYVTEECDGGDIIFQSKVTVAPDDSPQDIEAKVHELEMRDFPLVIEKLISKI